MSMTKKVAENTLLICWEAEQIESRLAAVVPVCQGRKTTWLRAWLPENVHISQWACVNKRVLCQLSRMMCYSLSWKRSYLCLSSFFNLEAWNKSFKLISDIVHTLIFFLNNKIRCGSQTKEGPHGSFQHTNAQKKPVQREMLNLPLPHHNTSSRTSLMSSKTMFIFPMCTPAVFMSFPRMLHA